MPVVGEMTVRLWPFDAVRTQFCSLNGAEQNPGKGILNFIRATALRYSEVNSVA